jgi:hypothetical protein
MPNVPAPIYERFAWNTPRGDSVEMIEKANRVIKDYAKQGYVLSLRQLYYQFVSRDWLENTERNYKRLGDVVTMGRMNGMISWTGIEDRGRSLFEWLIEEDVAKIIGELPRKYAQDMWANQPTYVEVWVEKDALSNVVQRACNNRRVPFLACKGYLSASEAWRAGKRFAAAADKGQNPVIIHLGDHDPSGLDMSRDNAERISLLAGSPVELRRIALNRDQIDLYDPPPNPAKLSDSRATEYVEEHGYESWELDALEPSVVVGLITDAIEPLVDREQWQDDLDVEAERKNLLRGVSEFWSEIEELIRYNRGEAANMEDDE